VKRHNFRELNIWIRSKELAKEIYLVTKNFPKHEVFGLRQQIRRAAVSIPANIAEGCGRGRAKQTVHFLDIAQGSAFELETLLILACELEFVTSDTHDRLRQELSEIQRMIDGFQMTLG
jgi:four helix bundle protein